MRRQVQATWIALIVTLPSFAAKGDDLADAQRLLLTGKYAEAAARFARSASDSPAAAVGWSRALAAEGKYEEAAKAISSCKAEHAHVKAESARLALLRGDYPAARTQVDAALRLDSKQLLARWIDGELLRTAGRLDEAAAAYRRLVLHYNENDVREAESLHWIGLAAAQYARWKRLSDQFGFLVNDLYPDALKADAQYWPAHYETGQLFLEKYNQPDAAREFKAALMINPNAAEVHAAMAQWALVDHDAKAAEKSARRALEINPRLREAWLVRADLAWENFQPEEALALLERHVLPQCPVDEESLGRMAACYLLLEPKDGERAGSRFSRLVEQVNARNPHGGEFYAALAAWLQERHQFAGSERFFQEAIRRMPQLLGPRAQLGLLWMHSGEEAKARKLLDEAFQADPFNVRVKNSLEVLEVLDGMQTVQTQHCILRFDGQHDKLLGRYAARYLDEVYPKLCRQFGYRPPGKPLVEVFYRTRGIDGHAWFSARMVGLPYLGAVAASTGRIVAVTSPNDPEVKHKFNWAVVLRHELVHVITLQQTGFNIPHWFTEALAVWSEGYPRPQAWNELLLKRIAGSGLFNLDTINRGFTRPHSSDDSRLAYCQAELYLEYAMERAGQEVIGKLLAAYADRLSTPQAIRRALGISQEEFERGFAEHVKRLAAGLRSLESPRQQSFVELEKLQKSHSDDPNLAAELAYAYLLRGASRESKELAERALQLRPKHALASYVLARLHVEAGQAGDATKLLEESLNRDRLDPTAANLRALNLLAGLKLKAEDYAEAERLYSLAAKSDPQNIRWVQMLAQVYLKTKNEERLGKALAQIARAESDDAAVRKKLAQLSLAKRDYTKAADWANQALEIDVLDAEVYRAFAESQVESHNYLRAIELFETAIELDPTPPQQRLALADAYVHAGKPKDARRVLQELLKRVPDYPAADLLLESLKSKGER